MAAAASRTWAALGTYVYLATDAPRHLDAAERLTRSLLDQVDRTCSRFRTDSDLSRANAHPGEWTAVDPLLAAATSVALEAAAETDGLVDPCLGRSLVALGYDADLAVVRGREPVGVGSVMTAPPRADAWREVRVDLEGAVRVPAGFSLDLGATAKAWASDLVARTVAVELDCQVVVSLGGDVRIETPPGSEATPWPIRVTERPDELRGTHVWLAGGGLATSSVLARRWRTDAGEQHHLLDPRDGLPVGGPWRTATATGRTCVAANTATTAALVLGAGAEAWLTERAVTARLVGHDGRIATTGAWPLDVLTDERTS